MRRASRADLVTIATFVDRAEAIIARSLLEAEGLYPLIPEAHTLSVLPHLIHAEGGYRLQVRAEDAEKARGILRDAQIAPTDEA